MSLKPPTQRASGRQLHDWYLLESEFETQVVVVDGAPIGHVTVSGLRLVHLFVDPDHQNMGFGRHFVARGEAMITAGGRTDFELHARVVNLAAIDFYEKAGWTVTDRLIHTVEHGISYDERVLIKQRASLLGLLGSPARAPRSLAETITEVPVDGTEEFT